MMISNVKGEFTAITGSLKHDSENVANSYIEASIHAGTINTRDAQRDAHLKSPDFFHVEKHPTLAFKSTRISKKAEGELAVTGDLTIRGVTRPVTFVVEGPSAPAKDPWGNTRMPDPWDFYLSSPNVWNGAVYFGSSDGNVYSVDANSGGLKWKFKTGDVVHSSPAIADGTLFIGSWDTYLYALDAANGTEKWRFKTGDDPDIHNHVGIQSSPAVVDGIAYFGSRDSFAYAVDAATGKQLWKFSTDGSWVNNSMCVFDGKAYFGTSIPGFMPSQALEMAEFFESSSPGSGVSRSVAA